VFGFFKNSKDNPAHAVAVKEYIDILNANPKLTDQQILMKMGARKISNSVAWEVIGLFPIIAGRKFMDGMGIQFSDTYTVLSNNGKTTNSGTLDSHPLFVEINNQISLLKKPEAFQSVALRGAELHAVNNALNNGSNPRDLVTSTVTLLAYEA